MSAPVLHWLTVPGGHNPRRAHLFPTAKRSSVCGHVVSAPVLLAAAPGDHECMRCLRPILRCTVCFRSVPLRTDGKRSARHPTGALRACSGSGTPVGVTGDYVGTPFPAVSTEREETL